MFIAGTGKFGLGEKGTVDAFVNGASSLVGVSLIIGLARGINLVLNEGMISDTILHFFIIFSSTYEWAVVYHCITIYFLLPRLYRPFFIRVSGIINANLCTAS